MPREPHDWVMVLVLPLSESRARGVAAGERFSLKRVNVHDPADVRSAALICARCELTIDKLGAGERDVCRG